MNYASGLSFQNQLMIVGGEREFSDLLGPSFLFDEDTGESKILPDMAFVGYFRPQMILVDHDFCQRKWMILANVILNHVEKSVLKLKQ